jgi:hypothetical protein
LVGQIWKQLTKLGTRAPYQSKVASHMTSRWEMISAAIPESSQSLLDIGSNLGELSASAAAKGLWSLGIERNAKLIREAQRRHAKLPDCHFVNAELSPLNIGKLPHFDVTLFLGVYHHWHAAYGGEAAVTMLRMLTANTRKLLVFEAPSRTARFKVDQPDFVSNDDASVTAFYAQFLTTHLGDLSSRITLLGKAPNVGEREPYRWAFAIHR